MKTRPLAKVTFCQLSFESIRKIGVVLLPNSLVMVEATKVGISLNALVAQKLARDYII